MKSETVSITLHRVAVSLLAVALLSVIIVFTVIGLDEYRKYEAYQEREAIYRRELARLHEQHEQQAAYLKRLLEDEAFFEHVVRERLGYSREGEVIIRFQ